jgi:CRISPR/Cas system-associated exonuclease Cas4 (RecB family)
MRGVRIHTALEISDLSGLSKSDAITASRIMYGEAELVQQHDFEGAEVEWEQRFWDVDDEMNHIWSSQVDTLHWQKERRRLLITDNKTGWARPMPIEANWQMKSQAALLGVEYYDAEEVVAALIHPHHPDSLSEVAIYTRDELESNLTTVRHMVNAIQQPEQPRTVGGVQCQYCSAKRICPEYQAHVAKMEQDIADEIEDRGFTAIIRRTPKQRGEHVHHLKQLAKHIEILVDQYTQLAVKDQTAIAGWTLRRKMQRIITDEVEAMSLVKNEFGADALYDATKFSIASLEENLSKKMSKKEAKAAVERLLSPVLKFKTSDAYLQEARSL